MRRLTVPEAAEALGITTDAVRMRLSRGTLAAERQEGRVIVLLEDDTTTDRSSDRSSDIRALVESKDETIRLLREQLEQAHERDRENRRIIAALTSRIPEIEAPSEPREAPAEAREQPGRVGPQTSVEGAQEGSQRVPWWRRMFGQ
jgi:chromosome segregation ATPase